MDLTAIAHIDVSDDPDVGCYGAIKEVIENGQPRYLCIECGATLSKSLVEHAYRLTSYRDQDCPYCKAVNWVDGYADPLIYVCQACGKTVNA